MKVTILCSLMLLHILFGVTSAATPLTVNTADREQVVNFFQTVYMASEGVQMGWTGNVTNSIAGDTSQAFKDAILLRINYFRAMAGLPGDITFNPIKSAKCQQAALMFSAQGAISHAPTNGWACYTAEGAEAAGSSNIGLGVSGVGIVNAYIDDYGIANYYVGHRRWMLYPKSKVMGSGSTSRQGNYRSGNAIWVIGEFGSVPAQPSWVAWPPKGYVPNTLLPSSGRWSFSHAGANFNNTSVSMQSNGVNVAVILEQQIVGAGDNTIVWRPENVSQPVDLVIAPDINYTVTVSNVVISGVTNSFTYTVTTIDLRGLPPRLNIQKAGEQITLSWVNYGFSYTLEEALTPTGPWGIVPNYPFDSHVVNSSNVYPKFYRLRR